MIHRAGTSHIASNLSLVDIAVTLYSKLKPEDVVVWSKGWAAALGYCMLAERGEIPKEDLDKFPNPPYLGLMEPSVSGVHVAGGSVGHGLPVAVGMALAKKRAGEEGQVYCIMSDGELNEGSTWEAAMIASQHLLNNLVVVIDKNGWQAMGRTEEVLSRKGFQNGISEKFQGFGWNVWAIDGHKYSSIETAINSPHVEAWGPVLATLPTAIVAETIKGKGVSFMENHLTYHYKHITDEELALALKELE